LKFFWAKFIQLTITLFYVHFCPDSLKLTDPGADMRGRPPKPTHLKILQGNPGKRALPKNEPKPEATIPIPPDHLSNYAMEEWKRIAPQLEKLGLISRIDRTALAAYCQTYGRWVDAEEKLLNTGLIMKTKDGNIIQNVLLGIANRALLLMHRYMVEFGMTPSSRARLGGAGTPKSEKKFIKVDNC
jgi:P27 family predicted phage terminase small subunit